MYKDNAVFIPSAGAVLVAPVGTEHPERSAVEKWISDGRVAALGEFVPLGHTSLDTLPQIESEVEGGEIKGSWENPSLRTTRIVQTDKVTVTPIQWSETPLKHRFGANGEIDEDGYFAVPDEYVASEVAMLVIIVDGSDFLLFHWPRVASAPGDSIEFDPENFTGMPVTYSVLKMTGQNKINILVPGGDYISE